MNQETHIIQKKMDSLIYCNFSNDKKTLRLGVYRKNFNYFSKITFYSAIEKI